MTQPLAVLLCGLLASPLCSPLSAAGTAALGQVVSSPPVTANGVWHPNDFTLFSGDRLATGPNGWARVLLPGGDQIHLAEASEAQALREKDGVEIKLARGRLTLRTREPNGVTVRSNGLDIAPRTGPAAVWEVARLGDGLTLVAAHQGTIEVRAANRTVQVPAGKSARLKTQKVNDEDDDDDEWRAIVIVFGATAGIVAAVLVPIAITRGGGNPVSPSGL